MNNIVKNKIWINISVLIATEVVLSRFLSLSTPLTKIGFGFVPIAICAILYGPIFAGIAGAVSDIVGAILFPIGPYFPGFTLSAALTGIVFGVFLFNHKINFIWLLCVVLINCLGISLLISTLWLTIITGTPWMLLLPIRIISSLIMIPVQFGSLFLLQKVIRIPISITNDH